MYTVEFMFSMHGTLPEGFSFPPLPTAETSSCLLYNVSIIFIFLVVTYSVLIFETVFRTLTTAVFFSLKHTCSLTHNLRQQSLVVILFEKFLLSHIQQLLLPVWIVMGVGQWETARWHFMSMHMYF